MAFLPRQPRCTMRDSYIQCSRFWIQWSSYETFHGHSPLWMILRVSSKVSMAESMNPCGGKADTCALLMLSSINHSIIRSCVMLMWTMERIMKRLTSTCMEWIKTIIWSVFLTRTRNWCLRFKRTKIIQREFNGGKRKWHVSKALL